MFEWDHLNAVHSSYTALKICSSVPRREHLLLTQIHVKPSVVFQISN